MENNYKLRIILDSVYIVLKNYYKNINDRFKLIMKNCIDFKVFSFEIIIIVYRVK